MHRSAPRGADIHVRMLPQNVVDLVTATPYDTTPLPENVAWRKYDHVNGGFDYTA